MNPNHVEDLKDDIHECKFVDVNIRHMRSFHFEKIVELCVG